jgi:hypothetical protein
MATERRDISPSKRGVTECAWEGCATTFYGDKAPDGWSWLLFYRSRRPHLNLFDIPSENVLRDVAVCPMHTRLLEMRLKESGGALSGPEAGSA